MCWEVSARRQRSIGTSDSHLVASSRDGSCRTSFGRSCLPRAFSASRMLPDPSPKLSRGRPLHEHARGLLDYLPGNGRRLAPGKEPPGRGRGQRHADDRQGEVDDRHVTQVAQVVVVQGREHDGTGEDAQERAEQRQRAGGGRRDRAPDAEVAPVATRVRRSPALSLRIRPTVIARMASARILLRPSRWPSSSRWRIPLFPDSIARPASAAA